MRYQDSGVWPLIVLAFTILFFATWCQIPADGYEIERRYQNESELDLPVMVLGPKEAAMMKQHLVDTGEYTFDKGYNYFIRTYDAGRTQPPGIEEYYHLTVHIIYVPTIAPGFNIGLEYELRKGPTNKWGDPEYRKVIQYHLDDGDEDLVPNSMIKAVHEFSYGVPAKSTYKKVDAFLEWRYWVYYWYSVFLDEGMK